MKVVLSGSNDHLIHEELLSIVKKFNEKHAGSIERFDGAELTSSDPVLDAVRSISFLDPRKLVVVSNFAESKELLDKSEAIVEQTADSTDLIIMGKFDKRSVAYKYLKKNTDFRAFEDLSLAELSKWAIDYTGEQGGLIQYEAASYLVEQIGTNQYRLKNELDKLIATERDIDRDLIDELVEPTAQSKVFALLDAVFNGRSKQAWSLYRDQRAQGEEPYKILAMIVWQLQQLTLAVYAPQKTKDTLVSAGMSPYSAGKNLQMAGKISPKNLRYYIDQLAKIDTQSKTNANIESALAVYIADVASIQATS